MADIAPIEQAILDALAPLRDVGLLVRSLPDSTRETATIRSAGAITVAWERDENAAPDARDRQTQRQNQRWVIDVRLTSLRDASGAWAVRQAIYQLLSGLKPPGADKIFFDSFELIERQEHYWRLEAALIVPAWIVEDPGEEGLEPLLRVISYASDIGGTEVTATTEDFGQPPEE